MTENQKLREAFEARMTDNGKWPRAVEQGRNGCYLLAQTENAWVEWQACAEALSVPTAAPEMPLSMNQFGRLVELTREHLTNNTFVYKATSKTGDTCHFGVETAAKAWAKSGTVEAIKVREFKLHTSAPTANHIPNAGKMIEPSQPVGELPEPYRALDKHLSHPILLKVLFEPGEYFTADQMRAYGEQCWKAGYKHGAWGDKPVVNQQLTTEPFDDLPDDMGMASRRARERANAHPWEQDPEPEDHRHDGDFPERDDDEQPERCPNTDDMFGE